MVLSDTQEQLWPDAVHDATSDYCESQYDLNLASLAKSPAVALAHIMNNGIFA